MGMPPPNMFAGAAAAAAAATGPSTPSGSDNAMSDVAAAFTSGMGGGPPSSAAAAGGGGSGPSSASLALHDLLDEIGGIAHKQQVERQQNMAVDQQKLREQVQRGQSWGALPAQSEDSKRFQQTVVDMHKYRGGRHPSPSASLAPTPTLTRTVPCRVRWWWCAVHRKSNQLHVTGKQKFAENKARRRVARQSKKADKAKDVLERNTVKESGVLKRKRQKNQARDVY
jgi:hypothetical protein